MNNNYNIPRFRCPDDEVASDAIPFVVEDEVVLKFTTKMITKVEGSYDMAGDDAGEKYDSTSETVNNLIDAHKLMVRLFLIFTN